MRILANLAYVNSSGVQVDKKHVDVDTSMRILVVENLLSFRWWCILCGIRMS